MRWNQGFPAVALAVALLASGSREAPTRRSPESVPPAGALPAAPMGPEPLPGAARPALPPGTERPFGASPTSSPASATPGAALRAALAACRPQTVLGHHMAPGQLGTVPSAQGCRVAGPRHSKWGRSRGTMSEAERPAGLRLLRPSSRRRHATGPFTSHLSGLAEDGQPQPTERSRLARPHQP